MVARKYPHLFSPLKVGRYTFYQVSYDPETMASSTLEVTSDPGVPLVFAGFILLCRLSAGLGQNLYFPFQTGNFMGGGFSPWLESPLLRLIPALVVSTGRPSFSSNSLLLHP